MSVTKGKGGKDPKRGNILERWFAVTRLFVWNRQTQWSALFWLAAMLVTYFLVPSKAYQGGSFQPGDIAVRDIKASQSYLVEDPASTQARRLEAEAAVLAVYDFDRAQELETLQSVRRFFSEMRDAMSTLEKERNRIEARLRGASRDQAGAIREELKLFDEQAEGKRRDPILRFLENMALSLNQEQMEPLVKDGFSERVETILTESFQPIMGVMIVVNREALLRERGKGVAVRTLQAVAEEIVLDDFTSILSLDAARSQVRKGITSVRWGRDEAAMRRLLETLSQEMVRPNLSYNRSETEARRKRAVDETNPVYYRLKKGEIIVRAGDPITEEQILKINAMSRSAPAAGRMSQVLGTFMMVALLLFAFYRILRMVNRTAAEDTRNLIMLVVVIILQVALTKVILVMSDALSSTYFGFEEYALNLAAPYAAGALIAGALFPAPIGLVIAFLTAILSTIMAQWDYSIFLFALVGNVVAAFAALHCQLRSSLIRAGLAVGGANVLMAAIILLVSAEPLNASTMWHLFFAACGGVAVSLTASMALPLLESWFVVATDMKLMELANLNQPVLKEMILKAPGSYHHSVLVGSLAEAAAEEIGANPLLARAGALYHDLGKVSKPEYFVENQEPRDNRHEKLSPSMSALILTSHVKDGVDYAREHRLPRRVVDIIRQHHGTRLITYFYNKAKEMEDPSVHTVDERDFRYPGPKPQGREAALIMLADAVEAASKVLTDPTPARIRGLVQKIINDIFIDGQLDESNLTLRDLHQIAKSFTRTITGIMHHRIDYPEAPAQGDDRKERKRKKADGGVLDQDTGDGALPEEPLRPGVKNIKRLGQT